MSPTMSSATSGAAAPHYISRSTNSRGESIGNGLFAGRRYKAGEQIAFAPRPLLGSLDSHRLLDTCANCYMWTEGAGSGSRTYVPAETKVQKCAGCQRFRYCSKVSRDQTFSISIAYTEMLLGMSERSMEPRTQARMQSSPTIGWQRDSESSSRLYGAPHKTQAWTNHG